MASALVSRYEMEVAMNTPKDDAKSVVFRSSGNRHYAKKTNDDYLKALKYYNQAICYAPNNSLNLSIAYANRSAVYFQLYMFDHCLENINYVYKINNYPADLQAKLKRREEECKLILSIDDPNEEEIKWKAPTLSYPPHEKVPYIVDCLEMRHNAQFGNHIVATRDLKVGDIVGVLKPFCSALARRYQYERCENCRQERSLNLIPCPSCTAVMFCNEACLKEAIEGFHKYECVAIDLINLILPSQQDRLTLRLILSGLSIYQNVDKFMDATEDALKKNVSIFEIDHNNRCEQYAAVTSLKKRSAADKVLVDADVGNLLVICEKIFEASNIVSKKKPQAFKKQMKHILKQQLRMIDINGLLLDDLSYHIVHKRMPSYDDKAVENNMSGVFTFVHLVPHSCAPNVLCSSYTDGKMVSIVRPIKAGEQLFHSFA